MVNYLRGPKIEASLFVCEISVAINVCHVRRSFLRRLTTRRYRQQFISQPTKIATGNVQESYSGLRPAIQVYKIARLK